MNGPLAGVRVLDLTHVLNGPFCTMLLAHMGADVVKVEHGAGDRYRHSWMPPDADRDGYESLAVNANKRCITLNIKHPEGAELLCGLIERSDVLVENFSLGVLARLGFGWERLHDINPRLIYASSHGYGEDGPYANVRAFAPTILSMSGWVDTAWRFSGAPGTKVLGIGDEASGVSLALGVLAALYHRKQSGEGQRIEVSMQEAMLGFMLSTLHTHFEGQPVGGRYYECADGYVSFHLPDMSDRFWRFLTTSLERPDAADDPRFVDMGARRRNFGALQNCVAEMVKDRHRHDLWAIFRSDGIASAPVLTVAEVVEDRHLAERDAFVEVEHPQAGRLRLLAPWIRFSSTPTEITHAGPAIGEHNREVYADLLDLDDETIADLAARNVI